MSSKQQKELNKIKIKNHNFINAELTEKTEDARKISN